MWNECQIVGAISGGIAIPECLFPNQHRLQEHGAFHSLPFFLIQGSHKNQPVSCSSPPNSALSILYRKHLPVFHLGLIIEQGWVAPDHDAILLHTLCIFS